MATRSWNKERASKRIDSKISELPLKDIEIREYVRETDLTKLPGNVAYRVNGVHIYADILNLSDMRHVTDVEGETCHRRTLRFLNLHYRAIHRILERVEAIFVDFHNQRLHSVVSKPYDAETDRVHKAVAMGQLIIDVLAQTGEDADHPAANVRIGIDTGKALAVNNGRRGHREPLFLGEPANRAAKRAGGGKAAGIYLTNDSRTAIGLKKAENEDATALTSAEIDTGKEKAKLGVTADEIVKEWKEDLEKNPIGVFGFSAHTPPSACSILKPCQRRIHAARTLPLSTRTLMALRLTSPRTSHLTIRRNTLSVRCTYCGASWMLSFTPTFPDARFASLGTVCMA